MLFESDEAVRIRSFLSTLGLPRQNLPDAPGLIERASDERFLTRSYDIEQVVQELSRSLKTVAIHTADRQFFGTAVLLRPVDADVFLVLKLVGNNLPTNVPAIVNVTGSTRQGAVMFSLTGVRSSVPGELIALFPSQVIRIQSREYFRVLGIAGKQRQALLRRSGVTRSLLLHDLSEQGLGLRLEHPIWSGLETLSDTTLELEGQPLEVPVLQIVYNGLSGTRGWRVGARIHGMSEEDCRSLRRWINKAETS